jgi:hypothetical protein
MRREMKIKIKRTKNGKPGGLFCCFWLPVTNSGCVFRRPVELIEVVSDEKGTQHSCCFFFVLNGAAAEFCYLVNDMGLLEGS